MLRRRPTDQAVAEPEPEKAPQADTRAPRTPPKGRPTPSRPEAQAARKAYLGGMPADPKERRKAERTERNAALNRQRQAMKTGDVRNYPARDQGPEKAFVRDYVDSRLRAMEFLMLVAALCVLTSLSGRVDLSIFVSMVMYAAVFVGIVLAAFMNWRVKRAVREKFGPDNVRGVGMYAFSRAFMPRFMRQPKPIVRIGGAPK